VPVEPGITAASQPPFLQQLAPASFLPSSQQVVTSQHYITDDFLPSSQQPLNQATIAFTAAPAYNTLQYPALQSTACSAAGGSSNGFQ